jgi:HAD domain in Swiss Army Knife RNA repair proteins
MRPTVLLDVDGVLNALLPHGLPGTEEQSFQDFRQTEADFFRILYSPEMGRRLMALEADVVWLTTWERRANEEIGTIFGWPELPYLERRPEYDIGGWLTGWWKSMAAQDWVETHPGVPFAWIDDDLADAHRNGELTWMSKLPADTRYYTLSPVASYGISPPAMDALEDWVAERNES